MSTIVHIRELPDRGGRFLARLADGRVLVPSSRHPFLDAARILLAEGADPSEMLVMIHSGTQSLSAPIGKASKLTVDESSGTPRFRQWRPYAGPSDCTGDKSDTE